MQVPAVRREDRRQRAEPQVADQVAGPPPSAAVARSLTAQASARARSAGSGRAGRSGRPVATCSTTRRAPRVGLAGMGVDAAQAGGGARHDEGAEPRPVGRLGDHRCGVPARTQPSSRSRASSPSAPHQRDAGGARRRRGGQPGLADQPHRRRPDVVGSVDVHRDRAASAAPGRLVVGGHDQAGPDQLGRARARSSRRAW